MLEVRDLHVKFHNRDREAVAGVSFTLRDGEILGLVGESGSGKSVTAMSIAGLLPRKKCDYRGDVRVDGEDMLHANRALLRKVQGNKIGVVFQEPMSAMDPLMKIGRQVEEVLVIHENLSPGERKERALKALEDVELPNPEEVYNKYPHELSGGMLQRSMIAAAIVSRPNLLLLDEPTTALDVTIQAQILGLLLKLNRKHRISMLFISHNLNVVRKLCKRVAVMQKGKIVEEGLTEDIFFHPQHPYTQHLIECIPARVKVIARKHVEKTGSINWVHDAEDGAGAAKEVSGSSGSSVAKEVSGASGVSVAKEVSGSFGVSAAKETSGAVSSGGRKTGGRSHG